MNFEFKRQPALVQREQASYICTGLRPEDEISRHVMKLQLLTVSWMFVECGVAVSSAWKAHSSALLAFGADSFVEMLSAFVVVFQFTAWFRIRPPAAARLGGILLIVLAVSVATLSVIALVAKVQPDTSIGGMAITLAALMIMPLLSRAKRRAASVTRNRALAADAVQSATCAYLAAMTLTGLLMNALFHIRWIDPVAGLCAVPILCIEARRAMRGEGCGCC